MKEIKNNEGSDSLREARLGIADYSLRRARKRLIAATEEFLPPEATITARLKIKRVIFS